jgi:hypothetical protein
VKTVLSYVLAFGGIGVMLVVILPAFATSLSYPAGRLMLTNLLRTQPNRAELVCRSMKHTFFEAIGAAIKSAAMIGMQDPAVIATATKPAYDAVAQGVAAHWKGITAKVKLPVMAAIGGLGLAISSHAMPIWLVVILAGAVAAAVIMLLVRKAAVERSLVLARADVLPEVERAFAEGRYVRPAGP